MLDIIFSLIDQAWVYQQLKENSIAMVLWTIAMIAVGFGIGRATKDRVYEEGEKEKTLRFRNMSEDQLNLIEQLYDEGDQEVLPTQDVLELEKNGLIKDVDGYDLMVGGCTYSVTLTSKGRAAVQDCRREFHDALEDVGLIDVGS